MSTVGTKSWKSMFSPLVERIRQALHHRRKKQFREKNLCTKSRSYCLYLSNEMKPVAFSSLFQLLVPTVLIPQVYRLAREPGAGKACISFQRSEVLWNGLRSNFIDRLHEITASTRLLRGVADAAVPLSHVQRAHELIKGSELSIMQECKHWPQGEKPEEFNRVVLNVLGRSPLTSQCGDACVALLGHECATIPSRSRAVWCGNACVVPCHP